MCQHRFPHRFCSKAPVKTDLFDEYMSARLRTHQRICTPWCERSDRKSNQRQARHKERITNQPKGGISMKRMACVIALAAGSGLAGYSALPALAEPSPASAVSGLQA